MDSDESESWLPARATSYDTTFSSDGKTTVSFGAGDDFASAVTAQPNGSIVVAGSTSGLVSGCDFAIARLTVTGILDTGFGNGGKTVVAFDLGQDNDDEVMEIVRRPDGSGILVGGYVERVADGDTDFAFVQLYDRDPLFADGFESGTTQAWSATVPGARRVLTLAHAHRHKILGALHSIGAEGRIDQPNT